MELLEKEQIKHDYLYWEFHEKGGKQAILKDEWKGIRLNVGENPDAPLELYNLKLDPKEQMNVAGDHPELVIALSDLMASSRTDSQLFNFGSSTYSAE